MLVPLQVASFHRSQEVFRQSDGVFNSGFHFLVDYVISVQDTEEFAVASHLQCLYPSVSAVMAHFSHAYKNMDMARS